ncbi:MAG: PQQ-dependent sugar dehydrogenase [Fibrobacteres bacterium]|nr:PQQ-dependent sugar dehydrogenase [Fibrobacterota bacterium]
MFVRSITRLALIASAVLAGAGTARAQGCTMPAETDFKVVSVIPSRTMSNPDAMCVLPSGEMFFIEQWSGKVWHYSGGTTQMIGTVPTNAGAMVEDGMLGIVADLNFTTTHWLYIYHTPAQLGSTQVDRYVFTNNQLSNPKMIISLPRMKIGQGLDQRHAGGGMSWNARTGDLFMAIGDDTYPGDDITKFGGRDPTREYLTCLKSSGNTNDLRGKVLRIHPIPFPDTQTPTPGVGTTYTIPKGNLFPEGTAKTRPEIYTMGTRNAYRVKVDSLTGWAYIGEVGADADAYDAVKGPAGHDHLYIARGPANWGWPFVNGNVEPYPVRSYETDYIGAGMKVGDKFDPAHLKNLSKFNTGLTDLPAVSPPALYYCTGNTQKGLSSKLGGGSETAMAGPVYYYDPNLTSAVKMPPYFHGKEIFGDYSRHYVWLVTPDSTGTVTALERIKASSPDMTDIHIGPDGTIYLLDYDNGGLNSIQYTGTQKDYTACSWIKQGCTDPKFAEYDKTANMMKPNSCLTAAAITAPEARSSAPMLSPVAFGARRFVLPAGTTGAAAYNVHGVRVAAVRGQAGQAVELPSRTADGVLFVKFTRD